MKCKICKRPMILDGDVFICHYCEVGINTKYKNSKECNHPKRDIGIGGWERCIDCGLVIKRKLKIEVRI